MSRGAPWWWDHKALCAMGVVLGLLGVLLGLLGTLAPRHGWIEFVRAVKSPMPDEAEAEEARPEVVVKCLVQPDDTLRCEPPPAKMVVPP